MDIWKCGQGFLKVGRGKDSGRYFALGLGVNFPHLEYAQGSTRRLCSKESALNWRVTFYEEAVKDFEADRKSVANA